MTVAPTVRVAPRPVSGPPPVGHVTTRAGRFLGEIVGTSGDSFASAVSNGVQRAAKTLRNMDWFEVTELRGRVEKGKVAQFQVKMKVAFRLDE